MSRVKSFSAPRGRHGVENHPAIGRVLTSKAGKLSKASMGGVATAKKPLQERLPSDSNRRAHAHEEGPKTKRQKTTKAKKKSAVVLEGRFQIEKRIGSGSFGAIFEASDLARGGRKVAVKMEAIKDGEKGDHRSATVQIQREARIYREHLSGRKGFPAIHAAGAVSLGDSPDQQHYLVLTLLGRSLEDLVDFCDGCLSIRTVAMIALQLLHRLEDFHDLTGHVHRDIKPENLMMGAEGRKGQRVLHLIDLGLAKAFPSEEVTQIGDKRKNGLTGTARYASVNAHSGKTLTRRDDLESAGYVLVYLLVGRLPWQGITAPSRHQRYEAIRQKKLTTPPAHLCEGLPEPFKNLLEHALSLDYAERPDYAGLRAQFAPLVANSEEDGLEGFSYDWEEMADSVGELEGEEGDESYTTIEEVDAEEEEEVGSEPELIIVE